MGWGAGWGVCEMLREGRHTGRTQEMWEHRRNGNKAGSQSGFGKPVPATPRYRGHLLALCSLGPPLLCSRCQAQGSPPSHRKPLLEQQRANRVPAGVVPDPTHLPTPHTLLPDPELKTGGLRCCCEEQTARALSTSDPLVPTCYSAPPPLRSPVKASREHA